MMFKNMKIGIRLGLGFSVLLVLMIVLIILDLYQGKVNEEKITQIVKVNNVRIQLANSMVDNSRESAIIVRNVLLGAYENQSEKDLQNYIDILASRRQEYDLEDIKLDELIPENDTVGSNMIKILQLHEDTVKNDQDHVIALARAGKPKEGTDFMLIKSYPSVVRWINKIDELIHHNEKINQQFYSEVQKAESSARILMIIIGVAALLLSVIIAFVLTLSITKPLKVATELVVKRDLSTDLSDYEKGGGEIGIMIKEFSKDIEQRIRLEKEMQATAYYARNLIEASLDPLVTISADGKITDVNNTTVKSTGVSRELLVGSDFADYFTEPDKARAGYKQVFSNGVVVDYPLTLRRVDGTTYDVLYNATIFKNEAGEVQGVFAAARDITERKKQEKELSNYRDQLEEMVNQRTSDLSNVLLEVRETVNTLVSASTQILAATSQVATGTAETATAISETSTTVEEVQQAAKQSSEKAKNVANSAQKVAQVSQTGEKAVEDTVNGMNLIREQMDMIAQTVVRLSEQSQSIGGIIASVTDLADQSNLLAVNAAIEAAKAGEQGKGFAVVAQEIKNLANQSKQATLQVRNILNDVQKATGAAVMATEQGTKAVEIGVKQSVKAGDAIRILTESSNESVQAATQIVASSQQQVIGMDQIGVAMNNINQAGTETAVSMVQAEKSAKSLHELGVKLKDLVEKFKV